MKIFISILFVLISVTSFGQKVKQKDVIGLTDSIAAKTNSIYRRGDSVFYRTGANEHFGYIDSAGGTSSLLQYRVGIGNASNVLSSAPLITGNRALISNTNGVPTHSNVTTTELGYVSGVTSPIQAQINSLPTSTEIIAQANARNSSSYLINRMVNGQVTYPVATSAVGGIHEFDIHYDSLMVMDGITGWYEMVYSRYDGIYSGTRYVAFHDKADLQANLASSVDGSGKVIDTHYDKAIYGQDTLYPSMVKDYDSVGAMYYIFAYGLGTSVTSIKKGRTIDEVISCQPKPVIFGYIDVSPSRNPTGGWIAGGFKISNPVEGQGVVLKAPSVEGPWELESFLFDNTNRQPAFKRQADGALFWKGDRLFYLFQGINLENRIGTESHCAIVEVQNTSPFTIVNQPTEIIHDIGTTGSANPVYLETPDGQEVWFSKDSSVGYLALNDNITPTGRGLTDVVRVESGNNYEVTSNTPLYTYGSITNTQINGISVQEEDSSGAWGFVDLNNFSRFEFKARFVVNALPASKATIFKIVSDTSVNQCSFTLEINSAGIVDVKFVDSLGSVTTYTFSDVTVTVGSTNNVYGINSNGQYAQFTLVSNATTSAVITTPNPALVGLNMFSIFSDKNLKNGYANQFDGSIYGISLKKIFPLVSEVGIDEVLQTGSTTTRNMTAGSVTVPYVFAPSGQYISMTSNSFYLIDNGNNVNTRLRGGAIALGTRFNESINQGDVVTSGVAHFDGGLVTSVTTTATGITLGDNSVVAVTASGQTITLPTAVGIGGRQYTIKLTASGTCTIATTSAQTIDGSATYSLSAQNKYVTVISDGTNWLVMANN